MPFKMFDGTVPSNGEKRVIAKTPYQILEHARNHGEMVPQTLREDTVPDYPVESLDPIDGDPIATEFVKADRSVLPVYQSPTKLPPLQTQSPPFKVK